MPATIQSSVTWWEGLGAWMLRTPLRASHWIVLGTWNITLAIAVVVMGEQIGCTANLDIEAADQTAYLFLVEPSRSSPWPAVTDGTRNPLFPWLLARSDAGDREELFVAGKRLNVRLSGLVVLCLGIWAARRMATLPAIFFSTIVGLGILLPISTYVGGEVLFYGLIFAGWMVGIRLLARLCLPGCAVLGAILGYAYLAKPSTTLFIGGLAATALARWWWTRRTARQGDGWQGLRPLIGAGLALLVGGAVIWPRVAYAWKRFGDPLQNTAAWCFWMDDWDDCLPRLEFFNPRRIHALPPEDRPSAVRYLARNGWSGMWRRMEKGVRGQLSNIFLVDAKSLWLDRSPTAQRPIRRLFPFRGFIPLVILLGVLGMATATRRGASPVVWFQIGFVVLVSTISFAAFSWYWVIAPGARFILALYAPVLACTLLAGETLRQHSGMRWVHALWGSLLLFLLGGCLMHFGNILLHPHFGPLRGSF